MNKFFSKAVYKETLREGRSWALIAALILGLEAVLIPVGTVINLYNMRFGVRERLTVDLMNMHPLSILSFTVIAPLLTIYLFRFLNRRDSSDFYHALPYTRTCLFVSRIAAVYTLSFLVLWGTTGISMFLHTCFRGYFKVLYANAFLLLLRYSVCVFLVVAAVSISVSVTGNIIANLAVALMIIFGPRLLLILMGHTVTSTLSIVNYEQLSGIFGNGLNQVTGLMFGMFIGFDTVLDSISPIIYTTILGILYLIAGNWFFNKRKSEAAQQAAASSKLQLLFRVIPALVFCMIPNLSIFEYAARRDLPDPIEIYNWAVLYLIGILLYFAYELVSSGKLRNLKKAVPGVLVLLGANVCVIAFLFGLRAGLLSYKPSAEKITSVKLCGTNFHRYDGYRADGDLLADVLGTIELEDPEIKKLVAERLDQSIRFDRNRDQHYVKVEDYMGEETVQSYDLQRTVEIRTGFGRKKRNIYFLASDLDLISQKLKQQSGVEEAFMKLPDLTEESTWIELDVDREGMNLELPPIYEAYREDIKDMGFSDWYSYYMEECYEGNTGNNFASIVVVQEHGKERKTAYLCISEKTPKARKAFAASYSKIKKETLQSICSGLETILEHPEDYEIESMECWHSNNTTGEDTYFEGDLEALREVLRLFESQKDKEPVLSGETDTVTINLFAYKKDEVENIDQDSIIDLSYVIYMEP